MIFGVAETVAYCSQATTLEAGSVILMGTRKFNLVDPQSKLNQHILSEGSWSFPAAP